MHDLDPVFDAFSRTPELAAVAADIGMREPLLLQSMYIFKQPRIGGEVVCHTDHTYLWTEPQSVVGFWFAIDDATTENGCMWALPGGHRLPVKARSKLNAARTATELEVFDREPYPAEGLVPLEARARHAHPAATARCRTARARTCSDKPRHAYTLHAIDGTARVSRGQLAAAAEPAAAGICGLARAIRRCATTRGRPGTGRRRRIPPTSTPSMRTLNWSGRRVKSARQVAMPVAPDTPNTSKVKRTSRCWLTAASQTAAISAGPCCGGTSGVQ